MRSQIRWGGCAFAAALALSACAATHSVSSNGGGSASPATPATAAAPSTGSPKAIGDYNRVVRNGQTLYCKKDTDTSTRMVLETCLTQAQAQAQAEAAHHFMQDSQGIANTPASGPYAH
jgi:hypothetical protein